MGEAVGKKAGSSTAGWVVRSGGQVGSSMAEQASSASGQVSSMFLRCQVGGWEAVQLGRQAACSQGQVGG